MLAMGEFVQDSRMASKTFNLSRFDTIFIATNVEETGQAHNMANKDNSLERFEFMEAIVRIALDLYDGIGSEQAITRLFDEHIIPHAQKTCAYTFRRQELYFEAVEITIRAFIPDLKVNVSEQSCVGVCIDTRV
jgi:hypothetical protein